MNIEDEYSGLDRRKFPRVNENTLMLYSLDAEPYIELKAVVCDISTSGLRFATEVNIAPQTKLSLEVFQAFGHDKTTIFSVPIRAETAWIRKITKKETRCEGENIYEVGIRIIEIKGEDGRRIAQYVEESN